MSSETTIQDQFPNFRNAAGELYLVRCFDPCHGKGGIENYALNVKSGACYWCGWGQEKTGEQTRQRASGQ